MRRRPFVLLVVGLVGGLTAAADAVPPGVVCDDLSPAPLAFGERQYIDTTRAGGEPVSVVAPDGSISVSAHAGTTHVYKDPAAVPGSYDFLSSYYNQTLNWRSVDGGNSWQYVGTAGLPVGPHSATSTGFSDPDYDIDLGGRIYNVEIDLANVAVFSSDDYGRSYNLANAMVTAGDRPWVTGGGPDEVYLYVNLPKQLWRSTDAGITWDLQTIEFPATGKLIRDPLQTDLENLTANGFVGPASGGIVIGSIDPDDPDRELTWTRHPGDGLSGGTQFFGAVAVDAAGNVYKATAGGYRGSGDTTPNGFVEFNHFERDPADPTKGRWGDPVRLDIPAGDAMWPWIVAGDDGRVAVTWYQTLVDPVSGEYDPEAFYVFVAQTSNGHGATAGCSDGVDREVPPAFAVANASGDPIHVGNICLDGTACNASPDFQAGDRRLGDFLTINHDLDGNIFVVSGDTMLGNPVGGPKPVANPIFIKQSGGDKLLEAPKEPGDPRCLYNLDALCELGDP